MGWSQYGTADSGHPDSHSIAARWAGFQFFYTLVHPHVSLCPLTFPMFLEGRATLPHFRNFGNRYPRQQVQILFRDICTVLKLHTIAMILFKNPATDILVWVMSYFSSSHLSYIFHKPLYIKLPVIFFFPISLLRHPLCLSEGPINFEYYKFLVLSNSVTTSDQWLESILFKFSTL